LLEQLVLLLEREEVVSGSALGVALSAAVPVGGAGSVVVVAPSFK
jgi:hypothetical protein